MQELAEPERSVRVISYPDVLSSEKASGKIGHVLQ